MYIKGSIIVADHLEQDRILRKIGIRRRFRPLSSCSCLIFCSRALSRTKSLFIQSILHHNRDDVGRDALCVALSQAKPVRYRYHQLDPPATLLQQQHHHAMR
ncbi:hypothetical protein ABW19_dt0201192 [Dactylella cylindrospora]|nr:hypothetical protein ABW19_dt0201192 [Dactylella cylindrospora]